MRPLRSKHRHVEPRVVGAESGRPDDGPDLAAREIDAERRRCVDARWARSGAADRPRRRARFRSPTASIVSSSRFILRSASAHWLRSDPENCALPSADADQTTDELHADAGQRVEIDGPALGRAGELQRRHVASADDVVDLVVALVEHAGGVHPPLDVPAPIDARHANVLADREGHRAGPSGGSRRRSGCRWPRRRRRARHRRSSWPGLRYCIGVSVAIAGGTASATAGICGDVARSGGQHDGPALPVALAGRDLVAVVDACAPTSRWCGSGPEPQ